MKKTTETLALGIMELDNNQLRNLKHHLDKGTKIICGKDAFLWAKPGCGCPATLSASRRTPKETVTVDGSSKVWGAWKKMADDSNSFLNALKQATQGQVKRAIRKVLELRGI